MSTNNIASATSLSIADMLKAMDEASRLMAAGPPRLAQVACNSRMVPDAKLIAPSPAASFQGIPIRINEGIPDGALLLLDHDGHVIGLISPKPVAADPETPKDQGEGT